FRAARVVRDYEKQNVGVMLTQVERPYLDREATVLGVDHNWRPTQRWNIQTRLIGSQIEEAGETVRGGGGTVWADYDFENGWRSQWILMHFGDDLEINDFGYLSRANLNYAHWQVSRRYTDMPETSAYSSHEWRWRIRATDNDHGLDLQRQFRVNRQSVRRDGGREYLQLNVNAPGYDDRVLRGHGILALPSNVNFHWDRSRPRKGNWELSASTNVYNTGLGHGRKPGFNVKFTPTYFFSDAFSVFTSFFFDHDPQWMIWQRENLVGTFAAEQVQIDAGLNWTVGDRQELRVKLQAIGMDARLRQAWRTLPDGTPVPVDEPVDDFSLQNLGFQVRYRYEIAPLSDLYIVYGRGGYMYDEFARDEARQLADAFSLRDSEQLVVKVSYRFEL